MRHASTNTILDALEERLTEFLAGDIDGPVVWTDAEPEDAIAASVQRFGARGAICFFRFAGEEMTLLTGRGSRAHGELTLEIWIVVKGTGRSNVKAGSRLANDLMDKVSEDAMADTSGFNWIHAGIAEVRDGPISPLRSGGDYVARSVIKIITRGNPPE